MYNPGLGLISPFRSSETAADLTEHDLDCVPFAKISATVVKQQSAGAQVPQPAIVDLSNKIGGVDEDARVPHVDGIPSTTALSEEVKQDPGYHAMISLSQPTRDIMESSLSSHQSNKRRRSQMSGRGKGLNERYARMKTHMDIIAGSVPRLLPPHRAAYPSISSQPQYSQQSPLTHVHQYRPVVGGLSSTNIHTHSREAEQLHPQMQQLQQQQQQQAHMVPPPYSPVPLKLFHQPPPSQQSYSSSLQQTTQMPSQRTAPYKLSADVPSKCTGRCATNIEQLPVCVHNTLCQSPSLQFIQNLELQTSREPPLALSPVPVISSPSIGLAIANETRTLQPSPSASTPSSCSANFQLGAHPQLLPSRSCLSQEEHQHQQQHQQQLAVCKVVDSTQEAKAQSSEFSVDVHSPSQPSWTIQDRIRQLGQRLRGSATSAIGLPRSSRDITRAIIAQGLVARQQLEQQKMHIHQEQQQRSLLLDPVICPKQHEPQSQGIDEEKSVVDVQNIHGGGNNSVEVNSCQMVPEYEQMLVNSGPCLLHMVDEDESWSCVDSSDITLSLGEGKGSSNFHNNSSSNTDKRRRIGDTTALRSNAHTSAHDSLLNSSDCVASGVAFCDKSTIITTKNAATMEARKKQEDKCDKETHGRQDAHPEGASLSNHMDDVDRLLATQDEELKVLFEVDDEDEDELLQDGEQQDAAMLENIASFERELEGCLSN